MQLRDVGNFVRQHAGDFILIVCGQDQPAI